MAKLSRKVPLQVTFYVAVLQPPYSRNYKDLGCSPFARHYSGNHYCFLFHRVLRCFSSPGLLPANGGVSGLQPEGFPHSEIRGSKGYLLLPAAYRSLSRPSSPLRAKASTIRSYLLSLLLYNLIYNFFQHVKELYLIMNDEL